MWYKSLFDIPGMTMKLSNAAVLRDDEKTAPLPMFPLDLDDDSQTTLDADAFAPPSAREESYIGTRPQADESESGETVVEAVRNRHRALADGLAALEETCVAFELVDPSAAAAQTSLRRRVGSLRILVHALEGVACFVETTNHDLFASEGLLAAYLAGVYLWTGDVNETLHTLARDLNGLTPNWAAFRDRLADVSWIFDMSLAEGRHLESVRDLVPPELHEPLDDLLMAFVGFKHKLDEPFG